MAKYYYTNMISALATGQISYRDAMCEILKRLCDLENDKVQNQADWAETDSTSPAYIKNKPSVQEFQADWDENNSLEYGYIQNKPSIPPAPVQSDWNMSDSENLAYIKNKPSIPPAPVQSDWTETNTNSLAYIKNKPSIPSGQEQSDWTETDASQVSYIKNKPGNTTAGTTSGTLVPPTQGKNASLVLHANGTWSRIASSIIVWDTGINFEQRNTFKYILQQYGTFQRASWSRYTQCFAYLQTLPAGANNTWGCQIVQEWIPGKFWHFKGWVFKTIANNSSITAPFFHYGINLDYVVEHTDLTAEQFAIAYNENRVYSVAKKIDGYQIDGNTDWFGRVNLTDTEIGGVMICNYDANSTTGYTGILRFGGWKYSGGSMVFTDYPLAQQGIGAFEFDIWVNPAADGRSY